MSNLRLKQISHQTSFGGCNDTCTARVTVGFESGVSNPALLHCEKLDASIVVHGDDFITVGDDDVLGEVEHVMGTIKGSGNPWCESR